MALSKEERAQIEEQITFRRLMKNNREEAERPPRSHPLVMINALISWFKKILYR